MSDIQASNSTEGSVCQDAPSLKPDLDVASFIDDASEDSPKDPPQDGPTILMPWNGSQGWA